MNKDVAVDLCDEDRSLREKLLKLFYPRGEGDFGHFNPFLVAAEIEKVSPNSFYSNLAFAVARSWHISPVLIAVNRIRVRELIGRAEKLVADEPLKSRWFKRSKRIIRDNFKKNKVPYEY